MKEDMQSFSAKQEFLLASEVARAAEKSDAIKNGLRSSTLLFQDFKYECKNLLKIKRQIEDYLLVNFPQTLKYTITKVSFARKGSKTLKVL
jgi:hypothetical protein